MKLPQIKKKISSFLLGEEGQISKKVVVGLGVMLAGIAVESAKASHCQSGFSGCAGCGCAGCGGCGGHGCGGHGCGGLVHHGKGGSTGTGCTGCNCAGCA